MGLNFGTSLMQGVGIRQCPEKKEEIKFDGYFSKSALLLVSVRVREKETGGSIAF